MLTLHLITWGLAILLGGTDITGDQGRHVVRHGYCDEAKEG